MATLIQLHWSIWRHASVKRPFGKKQYSSQPGRRHPFTYLSRILRRVSERLGLRTIKTFLSVAVSAVLMQYVLHDTPFFACIGAVVAVERTIKDSYKAALIRNLGTLVGGLLGIMFAYLTGNVMLLAIGVIPIILIQNALNKQQSIIPACIVYFAVVYTTTADTALSYGLRRIAETFLGTVVGLIVNHVVFPPKANIEKQGM
jgi:uncharacterized membrane protein YgaE (UPF0421/DUF939 family)